MSWDFVRFHEILFQRDAESFSFVSWKTKKFYSKKKKFKPLSISKQKSFVYCLNFPKGFVPYYLLFIFFFVRDRLCERLREGQRKFCGNIIEHCSLAGKQKFMNFETWSSFDTCWQTSVLIKPSGIQEIKINSSEIYWNECLEIVLLHMVSGLWSSGEI